MLKQLTFNYNPYTPEDTKEGLIQIYNTVEFIRKELYNKDALAKKWIRPRRKGFKHNSVSIYSLGLTIEINNKLYECLKVGITNNKKFIYLFLEDSIKKFKVIDIFSFKCLSVEYDKYYFMNLRLKN